MNPYLKAKREQYDALKAGIEGVQTRATAENRDLTEDELTSVRSQGEQAHKLADEIESLTEIENRHAKVAELAVTVAGATAGEQARTEQAGTLRVGSAYTQDRDPGHYRRDGGHSFFGDMFAARSLQDETATRRLVEHNRALAMGTEGPGVIPPVWMASEFQELARQQRRVANAVRNLPLSSAAPMSLPKQTTGSNGGGGAAVVAEQSAENAATSFANAWDSAVDTVAPKATSGGQIVSRQMLDSGNPSVDALIYSDLVADYNVQVEAKVVAAMIAAAGTAVVAYATEAAWGTALNGAGQSVPADLITTALAVRSARKLPADVLISTVNRYGDLLKLKDTAGRPLIPMDSAGPMNVYGTGSVAVDGRINGLAVLATDGVPATKPESILVARASDTILWESPVMRFRYEEPNGPESIKLGIWAYTATYVKYSGQSVKRLQITAA